MTRAHTSKLLFCLLISLFAAALGGLSVYRKVASFQPVGFELRRAGGLIEVTRVDDPRTGLRSGDRILLANGAELGGESELASQLKERPESELAVLRGDQVVRVRFHRPPLAPDLPYLILALIGVGYLLIGLYTLVRQNTAHGFLFWLWCLASAVLYLLTPVPPVDAEYRLVYLGDQLAHTFLPPLTLHLFLVFPAALPAVAAGRRRLLAFIYLPAAVLLALQLDLILWNGRWIFGRPTAGAIKALDRIDLLHLAGFALAAGAVLVYRLLRDRGWEQRRQLQWMAFGLAGGYLPFVLFYVVPFVLGLRWPQPVTAVAVLPLALVPITFAYAILRYKLWDIEVIARDIISLTLTLLLGAIGFSLVHLAIIRGVSQELTLARNLLSFAAGLGIAGLLVPARHSLSSALEKLQYRGTFGKRRALLGLGRDLLHERDLARLCGSLLERLESGMDLARANLYLAQGQNLVAVHPEAAAPEFFAGRDLGIPELWRANVVPLSSVQPAGEPAAPLRRIFDAGYRYAFPLAVRGRGVGLLLASYKRDLAPLNSEDVELIRHLLNQAALAIENAQLLGQLQTQLEEVRRLQSYSAGIFESSPAGIAVLDAGQRLVSANLSFAALTETSREDLIGREIGQLLPVSPLPSPGEGPIEASFCDASGRERHLQLSVAHFAGGRDDRDGPLRILMVHDVSERVAMENALKEKDRLAALGMLAAGVAHEVNTPITGISSYAQILLSDTAESDPHYQILKKVERQTFRAARIVNNLLEFARDRQRERRPVAVAPLVRECVDLLCDRPERRRIQIAWDVSPGAARDDALVVLGSEGELQQVFTNLLVNALDAMAGLEAGQLAIALAAGEQTVVVRIADSGPGIPPEKLDTIFQPFFSTKLHRGGTGLGLSISYEIVKRHGGDLRVVGGPGKGACFEVELPKYAAL
jgi:two-component system, NtrC family, sensor kinase